MNCDIIIYTWNPIDPCFDWNFGLVLRGWVPSKIEVSWVLGKYIYIYSFYTHVHPGNLT